MRELQIPGGWKLSPEQLRENLQFAQRSHHAHCYFQKWFGQEDFTVILIVDLYDDNHPTKTVTNDAEYVVRRAYNSQGDHPMLYCDTEGRWDELCHKDGVFTGFRSLGNVETLDEAIPNLKLYHSMKEDLN